MADDNQFGQNVLDPLRYADFLPGAHSCVNIHKKRFYKLLVKKGLVYMYDRGYDLDPDSPILRYDDDDDGDDDTVTVADEVKCSNTNTVTQAATSTAITGHMGKIFSSLVRQSVGVAAKNQQVLCTKKKVVCREKTDKPKKVLIVGAGISGLTAAYELKRSGHEVILLERQERVGGRIKTLHFDFQQSSELRGEAGAMRIPLKDRHYLTDAYIRKFNLKVKDFYNLDPEKQSFVSVHGKTVRICDFEDDCKKGRDKAKRMCDKLWPGWDKRIIEKCLRDKYKIDHIVDYYKLTIKEVSESAPRLGDGENVSPEKYAKGWREWLERWSKMSFTEFLSSRVGSKSRSESDFRPWPKIAIDCIRDINYIANPEVSVATILAEEIGQWWTPTMKTLKNGMEELPEAFVKDNGDPYCLENDIHYGIKVTNVERREHAYVSSKCSYAIKVSGRQTKTGNEIHFEADAIILTVPLNIMRQIKFSPALPQNVNDAISGIHYEPSTKLFLGFRERFWEKGKYPIVNGGISRTDLPIGQIVYPSKESCDEKSKRGVLLLYTWNKEALLFGAQPEDEALTEALREVQTVYEGLLDEDKAKTHVLDSFEAGAVQSWYTDPSAAGAYVHLLPYSYMHHIRTLLEPKKIRPIFFGGEAISFANGWIQGAIASGLRAAWQFFKYNEKDTLFSIEEIPPFVPVPGPAIPPFVPVPFPAIPSYWENNSDSVPGFSRYPFSI